ncbi:Wzz/FepE/Etk N-terminal domain-containing protein [Pseudomonas sp. B21-028]|uniref:Wzz/FepE/Etk N-terminal domain-containing protein n=1 Tax=Pseudomonas sp. B21-028 TaxID=2895480 RepID=UPI002160C7E0|nr:Wzz/FepE/Etk N-terminal domain-containing protein [Pseudomonas sp. B21-028]UVL84698.1 Wzz/FepE/Etk N-terminal domain-containing protein [Pseudomonas sp. B21-028]
MTITSLSKDEISLGEFFKFFARQVRTIAWVFVVLFVGGLGYAITRPTLYMSVARVTIGDNLNVGVDVSSQLENPEMIVYKYSQVATIKPIKNTRIVEVSAIAGGREESIQKVKFSVSEMVAVQNNIYQRQERKFIKYLDLLKVTDSTKIQVLSMLQDASLSSMTYSSEVSTTELPHSGKMYKNMLVVTFISTLMALIIGAIKEGVRRMREAA